MNHPKTLSTWRLTPRLTDYWLTVVRRTWKGGVVSAFLTPVLYVVAMGVLLGGFVHGDPSRLEGATSYLAFVAPGLLAAQAMQLNVVESTYPVMSAVKWQKFFFGMNATPLRALDLVNANLVYLLVRTGFTSAVFTGILALFGVFTSVGGALLACLAAVLTGWAIAMPVYAYATGAADDSGFSLIFRFGVIPQFLFSGAFFPIGNLDPVLETIARVTPLWQGVDLTRMHDLGSVRPGAMAVHLGYLLLLGALGWWLAVRRLSKRLAS